MIQEPGAEDLQLEEGEEVEAGGIMASPDLETDVLFADFPDKRALLCILWIGFGRSRESI